jgi:predicted esterase
MLGLRGKVSENGANRWFRRLAEGIFDQEDLARRTSELRSELELVPQLFGLGDRQVVALGYSNGANMAANLLLSGFSGFAGAILLRPMVPGEAVEGSDLHGQAILITSGQMDSICPPGEGERLSEMLVALKANVQFELVPAGHNLTQQDLRLAQSWMNRLAHTSSH